MRVILGSVIGGAFGLFLATQGFSFLTWQFWVAFGFLLAYGWVMA